MSTPAPLIPDDGDLGTYEDIAERLRRRVPPGMYTPGVHALRSWRTYGRIGFTRIGNRVYISESEVLAELEPQRIEPSNPR